GIELTWACTHDGVPCEDAVIDPQEEPVRRIILSDDSFDDFDGTLGYMAALAAHGRLLPGTNERVQVELWLAEASAPNYRCPRPDGYGVGQTLVCTGNNGEYITSADRPVEVSYRWINRVISEAGLTGEVEVARGVDDYLTSPTGFRPLTSGVRALYDVLTEPDACTRDNPCYIVAGGPLSTVVSALHHAKQAVPDIAQRVVVSLISTGIESSGGQVTKFIAHGKNMVDDPFGWKALFESFPGITVYHFPTLNNNQSFIYGTVLPVADMRWPSWSAPDNAHPANRIYRMIRGFESDRAMCGNQSCKNDRRDIQTPNSGTARWDFNRWYWWQDEASWRSRWWMGDLYTLVPALIEPASGQFDLVEAPRIEEGGSCSSSATCHCQSFSSRPSVCLYTEPGAGRAMLRTYVGSVDTRLMPAHKSWINRWATPPAPPPDGGSSVPITYDLVLSAGAGDLLSVTGLSEPRYAITSPLPPSGSFTWTVKARRDGETLDEASATFSTVSETVYAARITHAGRLVGAGETVYVEAGKPQVFSGILSSGQPVRFAWSESGTTLGVAPDLDRTWAEAGTHTLRLQIGDQSQWRHETEITVEVIEPTLQVTNLLPNEVFDEPTAGTTLSWKVFANSGGGGTCQADVAVTDPQPIDASHEAANTLTASFTVAGSARLTAGTSVRLVPGMRVPAGTRLDAWIEGCTEGPNLSVAGVEQTANYAYDVMVWSEDGVTLHDTQGSTASPNLPDFPTDVLDGSTRYHWQIRVLDPNAGFTVVALSEVATFGTAGSGPGVPQPFAPANGEEGVALDVDLEWNPPAGGAGPYWVQVASSMAHFEAPAELLVNVSGVAGLSHPLHNLEQGSVVFWRVKACQDTTCAGPWSAISSFTTRTDLDAPFVLGLRPDGAGVATTWSGQAPTDERIPVLAWRALPEAEAYRIQVVADGQSVPVFDTRYPVNQLLPRATLDGYLANDDLFDPARLSGTQEPAGVLIPPGTLAQSARYTWRVRAEAGSEIGAWSEAWTFETVSPRVARYYYLRDHIGSIRVTFDDEGDVVHAQDYYPFGETMPGRRLDRSGKAPTEGFTGHERDDETGLYYGLARYYDAVAGRWTTPDPNADTYAAWSPYHYAAQRPLNITDPDGKDWYVSKETSGAEPIWFANDKQAADHFGEGDFVNLGFYMMQEIIATPKGNRVGKRYDVPAYMHVAQQEAGVKEVPGRGNNPRVVEYHMRTVNIPWPDKDPWCASFINWVITEAGGQPNTASMPARAESWTRNPNVTEIDGPAMGAVMFQPARSGDPGSGHVTFVVAATEKYIFGYGGNQGDQVKVSRFGRTSDLQFFLPTGISPNYNVPNVRLDIAHSSTR
ncbi:MAG: TIGR02594 family protein, partial [Bacteroidota bacterium]